ncbi:phage tail tape measure protein [Thermodesulforhabdus norvegica]|uniref:Phage tail tape measure protein, TP901 family, core region n=1 Tax=Thermodesulforhabdus norvegica TaxID=39841 RepID=A0A1I4SVB4_9BACT|nr:phage tail tape measure protein [Thermodesulforhabdus norvegica]SFM68327.1 phage tail tape measure protein, TP901 family, core region [Thermodesulforhabdus norvegica]
MADHTLHIRVAADTRSASTALRAFQQEFRKLLSDLGKSDTEIRAFEELADELIRTGKITDDVDRETRELLHTYASLHRVAQARDILGLVPADELKKRIREVEDALQTLKKSGTLSQHELAVATLEADKRIRQLKSSALGVADALSAAKAELAALAGAGAGVGYMVKAAIDFESAMAGVAKTTGVTGEQLQVLAQQILELTRTVPMSATELAKIGEIAGQLGIQSDNIAEFVRMVAEMSTAFNMSAEDAATAIAKLQNVFGLTLDEARTLADAINVLGNNTAASEQQIVEALTRIGGNAKQFGLTAQQAAALADALIALGRPPEVAATAINALLTKLQTANVASKEFQAALNRLGIDARQLAERIRQDPQQALLEFLQTLDRLDSRSKAEVITKLFGLEYQDDISLLVGSLHSYEKALGLVNDRQKTTNAMQQEFRQRVQTTEAQIQLLWNSLREIAINIGTTFLPAVTKIASGLADITHAVADFTAKYPTLTQLATIAGTLAASIAGLRAAFLALRAVTTGLGSQIAGEIAAMNAPIGAAIANVSKLRLAFSVFGAWIAGWEIGEWLSEKFTVVRQAGVYMVEGLLTAWEYLRTGWESLKAVFTSDTIEQVYQRHEKRMAEMRAIFDDLHREAAEGAQESAHAAEQAMQRSADAARRAVSDTAAAAEAAASSIAGVGQGAAETVGAAASATVQQITDSAQRAQNAASQFQSLFAAVATSGRFTQESLAAVAAGFDELNLAAEKAGADIQQYLNNAFQGVTDKGLAAFISTATTHLQYVTDGAEQLGKVVDAAVAESFRRLGVDVEEVATGVRSQFGDLLQLLIELAHSGRASADEIVAGFERLASQAHTRQELERLRSAIRALGNDGIVSAEQIDAALRRIERRVRDVEDAVDEVSEAYRTLGITSAKELQRSADEAYYAYKQLRDSGKATTRELVEAFAIYAERAVKAAGAVSEEQAKVTLEMLRTQAEQDGIMRLYEQMMQASQANADVSAQAFRKVAGQVGLMETAATSALNALAAMYMYWHAMTTGSMAGASILGPYQPTAPDYMEPPPRVGTGGEERERERDREQDREREREEEERRREEEEERRREEEEERRREEEERRRKEEEERRREEEEERRRQEEEEKRSRSAIVVSDLEKFREWQRQQRQRGTGLGEPEPSDLERPAARQTAVGEVVFNIQVSADGMDKLKDQAFWESIFRRQILPMLERYMRSAR